MGYVKRFLEDCAITMTREVADWGTLLDYKEEIEEICYALLFGGTLHREAALMSTRARLLTPDQYSFAALAIVGKIARNPQLVDITPTPAHEIIADACQDVTIAIIDETADDNE